MVKIELDSQRPTSGEVNEYGEVVLNFIDLDGVYIPDDVAGQHNVVIKKMTVVADDIALPQNEGYIQKKENLSDGYTFGELTLSREDLDELINTPNPVKALYEKNPEIMKEPLVNYYNEYLKEDDFDDFEDIYGTDEDDELERLANTYGRDSDEFIDAESKKDLMDDAKSEQEKTAAVAAAINDEDLNSQVLSQLTNNEDVYIGDDVIIEAPFEEDEEEIGTITDEGLDFIAKTYSFDLIKDEDGSWGIYDTATPDQAVSSSIEEVKDIEIVGIEEQFEDGLGSEYTETYSEEDFFEESKNILFQKINKNARLTEETITDEKDEAYGKGYKAAKADQYKSMRTRNPYEVGTDTYRYWQTGYRNGEDDLRCGWYNESKDELFEKVYAKSKMKETTDEEWYEEIYERERDGDYETPAECCNCGADCHDGGEIINGDVYCPSCAEHERNK